VGFMIPIDGGTSGHQSGVITTTSTPLLHLNFAMLLSNGSLAIALITSGSATGSVVPEILGRIQLVPCLCFQASLSPSQGSTAFGSFQGGLSGVLGDWAFFHYFTFEGLTTSIVSADLLYQAPQSSSWVHLQSYIPLNASISGSLYNTWLTSDSPSLNDDNAGRLINGQAVLVIATQNYPLGELSGQIFQVPCLTYVSTPSIIKDGNCPNPVSFSVGNCEISCNQDSDCEGASKCCRTACGGQNCSTALSTNYATCASIQGCKTCNSVSECQYCNIGKHSGMCVPNIGGSTALLLCNSAGGTISNSCRRAY